MIEPIARIVARYGAGALVMWGLIGEGVGDQLASDPDVVLLIGMALGVIAEAAYIVARRLGRPT